MTYPTRCKIISAYGEEVLPGIITLTPDKSKQHIEKMGLAELVPSNIIEGMTEQVRITLDDGMIIWGFECWWEPIETREKNAPNN